jgi:hypothetical protein
MKKVNNLTLVTFLLMRWYQVAPSPLITRSLKFKASLASFAITQHIEQILSLHLENNDNYFRGPVTHLLR